MQSVKKRRPIIALLLSFIQPGLGQMYNGQLMKGIVLYLIGFALILLISITCLFNKFYGMVITLLIEIGYFLFILGDAFFTALKIKGLKLKTYNRWYIYIIIILVFSFLINALIKNIMLGAQAYKIPSDAMAPTLITGDHILVNKFIYGIRIPYTDIKFFAFREPKRGEVIVFIYPKDKSKDYIKRVVGVEGDKILIRDKKIYLNDRLYDDSFGVYSDHTIIPGHVQPRDNYGPRVVPKDSLFVMGDNRDRSADSRFWGFVNLNKVKGKAFLIYWSWGSFMRDVRWERIGKQLK